VSLLLKINGVKDRAKETEMFDAGREDSFVITGTPTFLLSATIIMCDVRLVQSIDK
jgi:hypothetical protein